MKKSDYADKIIDKILIKITEFNKDLYILINFERMRVLIRDYFNI